MMDAVSLLKQDHTKVKELFAEFFGLPAAQPERRRELAEKILQELLVHERIEEEIFYPAFKATGKDAREETEHAKEEHELVDSLVNQLMLVDLDDPKFDATLRVLHENVLHHIQDEEEKMLPAAEKSLGTSRLQALARDMTRYKEELTRQLAAPKTTGDRKREMEH